MSDAKTVHQVAPDRAGAHATIAAAIAAATDGDVIQVFPGEYHESLSIGKDIEISGVGSHEDIRIVADRDPAVTSFARVLIMKNLTLSCKQRNQPVLLCKQGNLDVRFLSLEGGKYGVAAEQGSRVTIADSYFGNAERGGIIAKGSHNVSVDNSLIERCGGSGLIAENCDEVRVTHSTFNDTTPHAIESSGQGIFEVVDTEFTDIPHAPILDNYHPIKFEEERAWYTRKVPGANE
ncbi:right-handed parallel beta-helix repeat-containing protein [bacterium]|jgi:hypothetical protein|nr:right-handed parallel beta-helix repeat-containing protein [bacterium]